MGAPSGMTVRRRLGGDHLSLRARPSFCQRLREQHGGQTITLFWRVSEILAEDVGHLFDRHMLVRAIADYALELIVDHNVIPLLVTSVVAEAVDNERSMRRLVIEAGDVA